MRIKELHLNKWKVIRQADLQDLSDFVVVAGPNGVGKTAIKESIVHVFQHGGNPPSGCSVILQATIAAEATAWGSQEVTLPQHFWQSFFNKNTKRLKTTSRLIQIDSNRSIDSLMFDNVTFQSIGNPEEEEVGLGYGFNNAKDRFKDICKTLHRIKSREVTSVYTEYRKRLDASLPDVTISKLKDPTEKYIDTFGKLLYPKVMLPLDINSTTIQYKDDDGDSRDFVQLSSGEKEVVVLTFDLLAQDPDDCVVLIDEPEVHLHPELAFRLIKVLKGIGQRNQYFLFTHSPDIIGNALDIGVHFIRPKKRVPTGNQAVRIDERNIEEFKSIPNIRETIGIVSVGKKLLFVEGSSTSIDRNVFATLAKSSKLDVAIIPSDSCTNVTNMALVCDTLEKGVLGVELHMVRDRDGLVDSQIANFSTKSKGRLVFLPFYHIENAFLHPGAIAEIANKVLLTQAPSVQQIEAQMVEFAKQQLLNTVALYVKAEIYFQAGNFDVSPNITIDKNTTLGDIVTSMNNRKNSLVTTYNTTFTQTMISTRAIYWENALRQAIAGGWSVEARRYFVGKRMLREIQSWLFGTKSISLWEHIVGSESPECVVACKELTAILASI